MTTDGSVEDLVRSEVSSGDVRDPFNKGELHASGVPHPFWGKEIGVLAGFLKKGQSRAGCSEHDRLDHSLAKLNGGSPNHHGSTCSSG